MAASSKKIITTVGIILIFISLGFASYFVYQKGLLVTSSDPEIKPAKIKQTNIDSDSFTISWMTQTATKGSLILGETKKLEEVVLDDNDQLTGQSQDYFLHYVTVGNLNPSTEYYFKIRSGEKNILFDNQGEPFSIKTAPKLATTPATDIISGEIMDDKGNPAGGSIVYVEIPGVSPLSARVKNDGNWFVNLSSAMNVKLTDYASYDKEEAIINLNIQGNKLTSTATVLAANKSSVPKISLGEEYDFTENYEANGLLTEENVGMGELEEEMEEEELELDLEEELDASSSAEASRSAELNEDLEASDSAKELESYPSFGEYELDGANYNASGTEASVEILNPSIEGEELATSNPEFLGTGPVGTVLTAKIDNDITKTITVDSNGDWSFSLISDLSDGEHELTLDYVNDDSQNITKSIGFVIAASDQLGGIEASASASPSPTPRPTATPLGRKGLPSTASGTPVPGTEGPTIIFLLLGLSTLAGGFYLKRTL